MIINRLQKIHIVDVVYVATIHPCHKELVALFLAHNKHVFVEKPAFTNVKDWDEMLNLAKSKKPFAY
ncbi:Gfo/Idh/MocA family oxidoreductase [Pseudoalteromonas sp. Hal099]